MAQFKQPQNTLNKYVYVLLFLLLLVILVVYLRITDNPLVFDSATTLNTNFLNDNGYKCTFSNTRCISYLTFFHIFYKTGMDMTWQNVFNIFVHMINTVCVFWFLKTLFDCFLSESTRPRSSLSTNVALFSAFFFGLNPVATYGTAYLIQRSIQIATFFSLLSLIALLKGLQKQDKPFQQKAPLLFMSVLFFLLASYSKEHVVCLPLVAFFLSFMVQIQSETPLLKTVKRLWWVFLLYGLISLNTTLQTSVYFSTLMGSVYEPHGQAVIGLAKEKSIPISSDTVYPLSVMEQGYLFFRYLFLWLIPIPSELSIDIHLPFPKSFLSWPDTPGFIAYITLLLSLPWLAFKKRETALLGFGLLAPALMFFTEFFSVRLAEQFVLYRSYLWVIFLPAVFPYIIKKSEEALPALSKAWKPLSVAYLVILVPITMDRLKTFDSRSAIWEDTIAKIHGDETMMIKTYRTYNNYGHALTLDGDMDKAIYYYQKSIQINPYYTKAHSNLAAVYTTQKKFNLAQEEYQKAIALEPTFTDAVIGLGVVYAEQGQYEEALVYYEQALKIEPRKEDGWYNTGNAWLNLKNFAKAEESYKKALSLNPNLAEAHFNLAITYQQWNKWQEAEQAFARAKQIKPQLFVQKIPGQNTNTGTQIITR